METQPGDTQHYAHSEKYGKRREGVCKLRTVQHGKPDARNKGGENQSRHAPVGIGIAGSPLRSVGSQMIKNCTSLLRQWRINRRPLLPFAFGNLAWVAYGKSSWTQPQ